MEPERFTFGPFVLEASRGTLLRGGHPVAIGHKALLLLQAFLRSPGSVIDKASLLDIAWPQTAVEESNLSVQIAALRKLLGTTEDGNQWIATVPRVGYRFAGPISPAAAKIPPFADNGPRPAIAVLPFEIIGDSDKEYVADGLTEDIITALARFRWFRVVGRSSAFAFKGTTANARQTANELGANYLLQGSVRHAGNRLRISAQLIDVSDNHHVWADRYDVEMADVFAIQDEIAERVVGAIEPEVLRSVSHLAIAPPRAT
jgi:TolB-like protein